MRKRMTESKNILKLFFDGTHLSIGSGSNG